MFPFFFTFSCSSIVFICFSCFTLSSFCYWNTPVKSMRCVGIPLHSSFLSSQLLSNMEWHTHIIFSDSIGFSISWQLFTIHVIENQYVQCLWPAKQPQSLSGAEILFQLQWFHNKISSLCLQKSFVMMRREMTTAWSSHREREKECRHTHRNTHYFVLFPKMNILATVDINHT